MIAQRSAAPTPLPPGWIERPLGELAHLVRGVTYQKAEARLTPKAGYLPILRAANIGAAGLALTSDLVYVPQAYLKPEQLLQPGDVIICMSSGSQELVGKAAQLTTAWTGSCGAFCAVARFKPGIDPAFAGHFFHSTGYRRFIQARSSGVNINNLRYSDLEQLHIPLPPLPEQQRLAAALERHLARLDAGTAALRRVQAKLSRYKIAVIQTAVAGRLVPQNPADEPASQLLQRLPAERSTGRDCPQDLPPLPEGWGWAPLAAISDALAGYAFRSSEYSAAGFQIVKMGNVGRGKLDLAENPTFIAAVDEKIKKKYLLHRDDILMTLTGTRRKRDYGFVAMVQDEEDLLLNQRVARLRFRAPLNPHFFLLALQGNYFQNRFFQYETGNVGQGNVRMAAITQEAVPVPPLAEQARIVAAVEQRLAAVERLEAAVETNLKRADPLRQAVLDRAFSGRLGK